MSGRARHAPLGLRVMANSSPQRLGHGPILPTPAPCPWHDRPRGLARLFRRRPR